MKNEKRKLDDLSLPQLQMLLKHLRLGFDHVELLLSEEQLNDLLNWSKISEEHEDRISSNRVELLGNMSLIINTILTSTFGAWMGISGCIGCSLGSFKILFSIAILAFLVSGFIGYITLSNTKKQASVAINKQRLFNLQLKILKIINEKLNQKCESTLFYLNTAIFLLNNEKEDLLNKDKYNPFNTANEAYLWLEQLSIALESRLKTLENIPNFDHYQKELTKAIYRIRKTIAKHIHFLEHLALAVKKERKHTHLRPYLPFLKILTNPSFAVPKYRALTPTSWVKSNYRYLLMGLTPTIWGGFASMFVFVGGIPNITRELGFEEWALFLTNPTARFIEISIAFLITCYFAFSYLYSSKKIWIRQKIFEQTEISIANEETLILENNHKLSMLYKVKTHLQKMISMMNILKATDSVSAQVDQEANHLN
ncbi:MAG: hypothetical protein BGO10_02645 [Chlamydia sp. 32-24]|nr:MAG: hypothetical protein BGO10_02645 [Chlamydia sp. 32-24]